MSYKYEEHNPRWKHHLDFNAHWHTEPESELEHERPKWKDPVMFAKRNGIVEIIKMLPQYDEGAGGGTHEYDEDLWWIVDEMTGVDCTDWFNMVWEGFYDWADANSVWVDIHKAPVA